MAEFVKVAKEYRRICNSYLSCENCPLYVNVQSARTCKHDVFLNPEESERIIMQWASEHPKKTNRQKFVEVFGCEIVTHEIHEAIPGHVEILNASDEEFEAWLNSEYKGGKG